MISGASFNVLDYGAQNDGLNATTTTAAIQAALDAAHSSGGGVVYFPAGTYNISAPLKTYEYVSMVGDGQEATVILKTTNTVGSGSQAAPNRTSINDSYVSDDVVQIWHDANEYAFYAQIRDMTLKKQTYAASSRGIYAPRCSHLTIERVLIINVSSGYLTYDCWMSSLRNVTSQAVSIGFYHANDGSGVGTGTSVLFQNCWINFDNSVVEPSTGYSIFGLTYSVFSGCACDNGVQVAAGNVYAYDYNTCNSIALEGCGVENHQGTVINVNTGTVNVNAFSALSLKGVSAGTSATVFVNQSRLTLSTCRFDAISPALSTFNWIIQDASSVVEVNPFSSPSGGDTFISYTNGSAKNIVSGSGSTASVGLKRSSIALTGIVASTIYTVASGAYYVYATIPNSGTNFQVAALVVSDGITATTTNLKSASNLTVSLSGLNVQLTSTTTGQAAWSIVEAVV